MHSLEKGEKVFIRSVNYFYTGEIAAITANNGFKSGFQAGSAVGICLIHKHIPFF